MCLCLNESCNKLRIPIGKRVSKAFPIQSCMKQGASTSLPFSSALEYAHRKARTPEDIGTACVTSASREL
jgi:hypothetical protein